MLQSFFLWGGVGLFIALSSWIVMAQLPQKLWQSIEDSFLSLTAHLGLDLQDIVVEGRRYTPSHGLLQAIQLKKGDSIFLRSPQDIQGQIEEIPWVKRASVYRRLPHTLYIQVVERTPIAIWQEKKKHNLVDAEGIILPQRPEFSHLPVVVGKNAPAHVPHILKALEPYPELRKKVTGFIWVGERRWDVQLMSQINLKLPETEMDKALKQVNQLIQSKKIILEELKIIDRRLPHKTILTPRAGLEKSPLFAQKKKVE